MRQFLFLIFFIFLHQLIFALKPDSLYAYRPENIGLIYKEFKVKTEDNLNINVWFFPVQDTIPWRSVSQNPKKRKYELINKKKHPTIIICNGDAGNMAPLINFAYLMCNHEYNIVTFDWRGFGESDKWPTNSKNFCYTEYFKDYNAVIDSIKHLNEVDTNRIGIYGFSTGAYLSFPVVYLRNDIKCLIARALTTDLESIKDYYKKEVNKECLIPSDFPKEYYPKNIADKFTKPCFLIYGEIDPITPVWMANEIYSKLKGEKELWIVKNVGHSVEWDESVGIKNYVKRMLVYFDKYLK